MTEQQQQRLDRLTTEGLIALLETLEGAVERVKDALVGRLEDVRDEIGCLEGVLADRGYEV